MRRVLKWDVPVDDQDHPVGSGKVLKVDCQFGPEVVQVWTDEPNDQDVVIRGARVFGTGMEIPEGWEHLGSVVTAQGQLVWHVFDVMKRPQRRLNALVDDPQEF